MPTAIRRNRIYFLASVGKVSIDSNLGHALRGSFDVEREVVHELAKLINAGEHPPPKFGVYYIEVGQGTIERDEDMDIPELHPPIEWRHRRHETEEQQER